MENNQTQTSDYLLASLTLKESLGTIAKHIVIRQLYKLGGGKMPKYTQEIKDKAVEMAKAGVPLKHIQSQIGPNPKATQRYLAKQGINYADLRKELREDGKLQPTQKKNKAQKSSKKPVVETVEE